MARRLAWMGAALAVVALVGGCSGGGGALVSADPLSIARSSGDTTIKAGSARYEVTAAMSATTGLSMNIRQSGSYDFARQIGDANAVISGAGAPDETVRGVIARNVMYEQAPGSRWRKTDLSGQVNTPIGQQDPAEQLQLMRGVSDDLRVVGADQVRGTAVQHYTTTIDPKRLAANVSVVVPGSLTEKAVRSLEPMPADVYVDDEGRVRKFGLKMQMLSANYGLGDLGLDGLPEDMKKRLQETIKNQRADASFTIEYFDFGASVTAAVPDASLVDEGPRFPR